MQSRHSKLYCLCSRDIQNFIVCAVATFKTLLFVQSRHSKLYCLCSRDIQNFIVCAVATFKTLLFVQSRHSKLYCLCSRDIQNFIVCAVETFETLLFVQSRHSKLYCLCSRAIRNFLVCVSLLGLRNQEYFPQEIYFPSCERRQGSIKHKHVPYLFQLAIAPFLGVLYFKTSLVGRRVATCKPGKPGLTSFSETLAFFFIQFLSFRKMKVQDRQNDPSKSFRAYQKKT